MAGEDTSSAALSAPPLTPRAVEECKRERLIELGDQVVAATAELGLPHWFWPEAVAVLGMIDFARATARGLPGPVLQYLDVHRARPLQVGHVNDLAPGIAAVRAADTGAFGLDWVIDRLAGWITGAGVGTSTVSPAATGVPVLTRAPNGAIEHWPGGVWADTVYMAGMFLGQLGRARRDPALIDEFGRQLLAHAELLQHPESGLYAHGSHRGETIWCFWGRANAWIALAGVGYLELAAGLPGTDPTVASAVAARLRRQLIALADRQPPHGVWSVLVDDQVENAGILETSAAAGIGAAMLRAGAVLDDLPPSVAAAGDLAARASLAYLDNGLLTRVSAGTVLQLVPFGYSVIRNDRPQLWGQGLALQAIAALLDHQA
jgi:unsaturated rhamnogalacturonyl hydrolase